MYVVKFVPDGLYLTAAGDFCYFKRHILTTSVDKYVFSTMMLSVDFTSIQTRYIVITRYMSREPDNNFSTKVDRWHLLGE